MFKKTLLAVLLALSFFAAVGAEAAAPPTCNPCQWVK